MCQDRNKAANILAITKLDSASRIYFKRSARTPIQRNQSSGSWNRALLVLIGEAEEGSNLRGSRSNDRERTIRPTETTGMGTENQYHRSIFHSPLQPKHSINKHAHWGFAIANQNQLYSLVLQNIKIQQFKHSRKYLARNRELLALLRENGFNTIWEFPCE